MQCSCEPPVYALGNMGRACLDLNSRELPMHFSWNLFFYRIALTPSNVFLRICQGYFSDVGDRVLKEIHGSDLFKPQPPRPATIEFPTETASPDPTDYRE